MFIWQALFLLVILISGPVWACAGNGCSGSSCVTASVTFDMPRASITADTLVNLLQSGAKVTLIECRSPLQKKDLRIPGAQIVMDNADPASLTSSLPATDTLIILYPGLDGARVASVSENLHNLGYLSILEYADGVYGWITYGYEPAGENHDQ